MMADQAGAPAPPVGGAQGRDPVRLAHDAEGCPPPSAAGHLEPYGVRVVLWPRVVPLEAGPFVESLLMGIAERCVAAGATLIGHLKCVLHTEDGRVFGNLTSVRSGASVRGEGAASIPPGGQARLDLAVLVYGLSAEVIEAIVREALEGALAPAGVEWEKGATVPQTGA